jgi:hypothetical protein
MYDKTLELSVTPSNEKKTEITTETSTAFVIIAIFMVIFMIVWFIAGVAAFIASIVCMFYEASIGAKIAGFVLAIGTGPFYWLYYIYNLSYCNKYMNYYPQ